MERLTATIANAHPKAVQQAQAVLKNNAEKGKKIAKEKAPVAKVHGGFLRDHITTSYQGMEAKIHAEAGYSGYQEYGTRFQPGTPFLRPMLEQIQPQFQKDMTDVMKGVFK